MTTDFVNWLNSEIGKRGWTVTETARRADMSQSLFSMVLSGKSGVGIDMCNGIARAFNLPPEIVLAKAGLIPSAPEQRENESTLLSLYRNLPERDRGLLVAVAGLLYERRHGR